MMSLVRVLVGEPREHDRKIVLFLSHRKLLRIPYETKRSAGCAARRWEDRFAILLARLSSAALPSGMRGWGSRSPLADFVPVLFV